MQRRAFRLFGLLAGAALILPALPALADPPAHAPAWGYRGHQDAPYAYHDDDRLYGDRDGDRDDHRRGDWDDARDGTRWRYRHDRDWDHDRSYYGRPVYLVERLPRGF